MKDGELREILLSGITLFNCESIESFFSLVLDRLVSMVESSGALLIPAESDAFSFKPDRLASWNISEKYLSAFCNYYHKFFPFKLELFSVGSIILAGDQVVPQSTLIRTKYYTEFLKPQSLYHHLIVVLRSDQNILGVVFLFRPEQEQPFMSREKEKLRLIAPYITSALKFYINQEKVTIWEDVFESTLKQLPHQGFIILDDKMELLYCSPFARQTVMIDGGGFRGHKKYKLPDDLFNECGKLFTGNSKDQGAIHLKYDSFGQEGVKELAIDVKMMKRANGKVFIIMGLNEEETVLSLSQQLKNLGISTRELDVVFLLYQGLKNMEIAEKLFISEHTVENHLRSIYHKMDVNNRTSLVHKLIRMGEDNYRLIPIQDFPSL